jgi:GDP-4-dehydro-6-deoxy-D-mannose reductase
LSELAVNAGASVFGFARRDIFSPGVTGRHGDITRHDHVEDLLAGCKPDWIFHLAALVHGSGVHAPGELLRVNVEGTRHLLEAARKIVPGARVLISGSSGIYGQPSNPAKPIDETARLQPRSAYAVSKAAQDMMAGQFFLEHGLHVVRARTFNQTGPREPAGLVCAMLARQVARIEAGIQEPVLRVTTLGTRRDFCDVRDVVAGYWAALEHGVPGEVYNICSGKSQAIRQFIGILLSHASLKDVRIEETGPAPEPGAILEQVGDASRLHACSGWKPRVSMEQSLRDLLDEWRSKIREEA